MLLSLGGVCVEDGLSLTLQARHKVFGEGVRVAWLHHGDELRSVRYLRSVEMWTWRSAAKENGRRLFQYRTKRRGVSTAIVSYDSQPDTVASSKALDNEAARQYRHAAVSRVQAYKTGHSIREIDHAALSHQGKQPSVLQAATRLTGRSRWSEAANRRERNERTCSWRLGGAKGFSLPAHQGGVT